MGFPITTARAQFIEDVLLLSEEMTFPVDRKNAMSLIQLTLGTLLKQRARIEDEFSENLEGRRKGKEAGDAFVRRVLRKSEDSGRAAWTDGE